MTWQIGEPEDDEFAFIFDSWARAFKTSKWAGCIPNHLYDQVSRTGMSEIVDRGALVRVAHLPLEDGTRRIVGYSVSEPDKNVLHWLYVKQTYRGMGVAKLLLADLIPRAKPGPWEYTYRTQASAGLLGSAFHHAPVHARVKAE